MQRQVVRAQSVRAQSVRVPVQAGYPVAARKPERRSGGGGEAESAPRALRQSPIAREEAAARSASSVRVAAEASTTPRHGRRAADGAEEEASARHRDPTRCAGRAGAAASTWPRLRPSSGWAGASAGEPSGGRARVVASVRLFVPLRRPSPLAPFPTAVAVPHAHSSAVEEFSSRIRAGSHVRHRARRARRGAICYRHSVDGREPFDSEPGASVERGRRGRRAHPFGHDPDALLRRLRPCPGRAPERDGRRPSAPGKAEGQRARAGGQGLAGEDPLPVVGPGIVAVEVDPGIEKTPLGSRDLERGDHAEPRIAGAKSPSLPGSFPPRPSPW